MFPSSTNLGKAPSSRGNPAGPPTPGLGQLLVSRPSTHELMGLLTSHFLTGFQQIYDPKGKILNSVAGK